MLGSIVNHVFILAAFLSILTCTTPTPNSTGFPSAFTPSLGTPGPKPVCVNMTEHPNWNIKYGNDPLYVEDCFEALRIVKHEVSENLFQSFDFYSDRFFPGRAVTGGWPLPFGAESGGWACSCLYS